jgi:hypothetical protein
MTEDSTESKRRSYVVDVFSQPLGIEKFGWKGVAVLRYFFSEFISTPASADCVTLKQRQTTFGMLETSPS